MVFWLFKKRDDTEERFRNLHDVLKTTFSNVREDIDRLHKWVESSHEHHNSHRINFKEHELRLLKLENQISLLLDKVLHEEAPEKDYSSVRSTISDYLTILSAWGLIKKQRVGKESFVAVSDHGLDLVSESNIKQKKKKLKAKRKN